MIDPIFSLPYEISAEILTDWLKLESVVRMDTAYCKRSTSKHFLQMLSWRRFSLLTTTKSKTGFLLWILARGFNVSRLVFTKDLCMAEISRSVKKSTYIRVVVLNELITVDVRSIMAVIAYHCRNIRILRVVNCELDASFRSVLERNKDLRELIIHAVDLRNLNLEGIRCPKLERINTLTSSSAIVDALMSAGPSITQLTVDRSPSLDGLSYKDRELWRVPDGLCSTRLRSLSLQNLTIGRNDMHRFTFLFQNVTNLSLVEHELTDEVITVIARCCACLRTVSLKIGFYQLNRTEEISPTNLSLIVLASYHALSLQVVHLKSIELLSTRAIISFLQACPNLHTLLVDAHERVRFRVTADFMEAVHDHPRLSTLLIMSWRYLSEDAIRALCEYGTSLKVLGVSARLDYDTLVRVLDACTSLHTFYLPSWRSINVSALQAAYPHIRIVIGATANNVFTLNTLAYPTYLHEVL